MARKESITKQMLLDSAFAMLRKNGLETVTARKLAVETGCSTQPIFRIYKNMDELYDELFQNARSFYEEYFEQNLKQNDTPFVGLGLVYIQFAQQETNVFKLLFLTPHGEEQTMYDMINGSNHQGFVIQEIRRISNLDPDKVGTIFMKIFTFIHGMACMAVSGEFDLEEAEITSMISDAYEAFLQQ